MSVSFCVEVVLDIEADDYSVDDVEAVDPVDTVKPKRSFRGDKTNSGFLSAGFRGAMGIGRKKGSKNKQTTLVRHAIETAFDKLGGADGLAAWAAESDVNKRIFYSMILPKLLPLQIKREDAPAFTEIIIRRAGEELGLLEERMTQEDPVAEGATLSRLSIVR
jgi:hypothetical protein